MDGVHDMGGMHGFGPVDVEDDAAFHADWERVVFAIDRVLRSQGVFEIDEKRHAIERMDPDAYLAATYFERWLAAHETLLVEHGVLDEDEIEARVRAIEDGDEGEVEDEPGSAADATPPEGGADGIAATFREAFESPAAFDRDPQEPRFEAGDAVVVRNRHPAGHTRSPRYARRARGRVDEVHGTFVLPDANAHGEEAAEPLYAVSFDAAELWGEDREGPGTVSIDLWERYLDAA